MSNLGLHFQLLDKSILPPVDFKSDDAERKILFANHSDGGVDQTSPSVDDITYSPWSEDELGQGEASFRKWILNPLLSLAIPNTQDMITKLEVEDKSAFGMSIEREFLRVMILKYKAQLSDMTNFIRIETKKHVDQLLGVSIRQTFYISQLSIVDALCKKSLPELEDMKTSTGDVCFPDLRKNLVEFNNDQLSVGDFVGLLKELYRKQSFTPTDLGCVVSMMQTSWVNWPLKDVFSMLLVNHSFTLGQQPITVGNVMARVMWQNRTYPQWINTLLASSKYKSETQSLIDELESKRIKYRVETTPLLLPLGMNAEAKRIHGKLVHGRTKALLGNISRLAQCQNKIRLNLERVWETYCQASTLDAKLDLWTRNIERLGLDVDQLEEVIEHMKRKKGVEEGDGEEGDGEERSAKRRR